MAEYFENMASPAQPGSGIAAKGLDECLPSNEAVKGEADAAAVGFRNARRKHPNAYIAAWGSQAGDMRFASLMADGTFSLAMVEGYSCKTDAHSPLSCSLTAHRTAWLSDCPGCGGWPAGDCCGHAQATTPIGGDPVNWIAGYLPRLDFARKMGCECGNGRPPAISPQSSDADRCCEQTSTARSSALGRT